MPSPFMASMGYYKGRLREWRQQEAEVRLKRAKEGLKRGREGGVEEDLNKL